MARAAATAGAVAARRGAASWAAVHRVAEERTVAAIQAMVPRVAVRAAVRAAVAEKVDMGAVVAARWAARWVEAARWVAVRLAANELSTKTE